MEWQAHLGFYMAYDGAVFQLFDAADTADLQQGRERDGVLSAAELGAYVRDRGLPEPIAALLAQHDDL